MTLVIAHRGASVDARENTLEAFALACEQRADMIETDLHLARDGSVPLVHDARLDGAALADLTLDEIRARAPDVATLDQALDAFGSRIPFNLELKRGEAGRYPGLEARALEAVRTRGLLERTLFSSFADPILAQLRELEPAARIALLVSPRSNFEVAARAAALRAEAVNPQRSITREPLIRELHDRHLSVYVFTVDDAEDQRRLIEWGADGIFTNVPARLRALLGS